MRFILAIVFVGLACACMGQRIYPAEKIIFSSNTPINRLTLFQASSGKLVVFERNKYWYADSTGNMTEGPFIFGSKKIEPLSPRLSPSGDFVSLEYPAQELGDDRILVVYDLTRPGVVNADKLLYAFELNEISFASDSILRWYSNNRFDGSPFNKFWDFTRNREKYFTVDSFGNGFGDYTMYNGLLLYTRKNRDTLFLNAMDSNAKKFPPTVLTGVKNPVGTRFTSNHPYLYVNEGEHISIYSFNDSSYHLEHSIEGKYDIVSGTGDKQHCYLLLRNPVQDAYFVFDVKAGKTHAIDRAFHPNTVFQLYPSKKLLTASHPWDGSIQFYSLTTGELLRQVNISTGNRSIHSSPAPDTNVIQNSVSVLIKQSANTALWNFYNEQKREVIQVRQNKIAFVDAVSGCIKRWIPFSTVEKRSEYELSPSKRFILSRNITNGEQWKYPYNIQVTDIDSGRLLMTIQSSEERLRARFLNNDLLYVDGSSSEETLSFSICDLKTNEKQSFAYPKDYYTMPDVTNSNDGLYFIFKNDTSLIVQRSDGLRVFRTKAIQKDGKAFFSSGIPYLFIQQSPNELSVYRVTTSKATFIRKIPASKNITAANGIEGTCLVYSEDYATDIKYVYNVVTGKESLFEEMVPELSNITPEISSLAYSPDGRYLATANPRGKVMLWDLGTGKETKVLKVDKGGYITKLCFSPDGTRLAASSGDIWETSTGKNILSVTNRNIYNVNAIDISKNGKYILSGGAYVLLWDAESGEILNSYIKLDSSAYRKELGGGIKEDYPFMVYSTAFNPDSKTFATGNKKGTVEIRDIDTGFIRRKNLATINQQDQKIIDLKYTANGEYILALQQRTLYKLNSTTLAIIDSIAAPSATELLGIDMSYDGKSFVTIATQSGSQSVQLRKLDDLCVIKEFTTPGAIFNKVSFSPNRQHLATASDDGFCTIWDIGTGKPVMYLNNIGEYGNVMVTPDNYYMASKSALNEVAFNIDGEYYSFDQFDIYLNRPDIVLERLHYASPDLLKFYRLAYFKRLAKLKGNADTTIVYNVPALDLLNRSDIPFLSKSGNQQLNFKVRDSLAAGGVVEVRINNNKVFTRHLENTLSETVPVNIELGTGKNIVEAVYTNSRNIESRKQKITIEFKPMQPKQPKLWYIGIGISKYKDSGMNLRYAAKDIRDIAAAMKKKYPLAVIDTLLDGSATKENIIALKKKLLATGVNDKVIVSFSGHGLVDDSLNWYFGTYNIDFKNPAEKGLAYDVMQNLLDGIPARQKLLLLDACHSGEQDKESDITFANKETAMQQGVKETGARGISIRLPNSSKVGLQNSFELMQELFANLQYGSGATVIAAAGGKEYAFENDTWKNGVFTYSLLKALRSRDTDVDENGLITVQELKTVVFESVKQLTGGRQKPTSRVEAYEDWAIW